jgi:hypothetical protein
VGHEKLVEPLREITITKSTTNPGGATTLWIRASDGVLMLGNNPVSSGSGGASSLTPRAHLYGDGVYQLLPTNTFTLIGTVPMGTLFQDYSFGVSDLTNPSNGIIKYVGTSHGFFRINFVLDAQIQTADQQFEFALWVNGVTFTRNIMKPPVNSILPLTFLETYGLVPGDEIGVAFKLSAGSNVIVHHYWLYVELII